MGLRGTLSPRVRAARRVYAVGCTARRSGVCSEGVERQRQGQSV